MRMSEKIVSSMLITMVFAWNVEEKQLTYERRGAKTKMRQVNSFGKIQGT